MFAAVWVTLKLRVIQGWCENEDIGPPVGRLEHDTFNGSGLEKSAEGRTRPLYSLRYTHATLAMLRGGVDIHALSKQMGNSAAMIERYYRKLTATMAAKRLA